MVTIFTRFWRNFTVIWGPKSKIQFVTGLLTSPWANEAKAEAEATQSEAEAEATESETKAEAEASHHGAEAMAEATN